MNYLKKQEESIMPICGFCLNPIKIKDFIKPGTIFLHYLSSEREGYVIMLYCPHSQSVI